MTTKKLIPFLPFLIFSLLLPSLSALTITVDETELVRLIPEAFDPDNDNITFYYSPPLNEMGQWQTTYQDAGTYHATITASDGVNNVTEEITIIVNNINRPPILNISDLTINEGEKIILPLPEKDLDGDPLTYKINKPLADKEWSTTYEDAGTYNINISVTDGEFSDEKQIKITVNDIDRPPLFEKIPNYTLDETKKLKIKLRASDPDGDAITFSAQNLPPQATLEDNLFEFRPDYDFIQKPKNFFYSLLDRLRITKYLFKFQTKTIPLTFSACGNQLCSNQTIFIIVNNVNRPPLLEKIPDLIINESQLLQIIPQASDPDNDYLRFYFTSPLDSNGEWQTTYQDAGTYSATLDVTDGDLHDGQEINITVLDVNRPPQIKEISDRVVNENETVWIGVDVYDPDNNPLEIWPETEIEGYSFSEQLFQWTPPFNTVKNKTDTLFHNLISRSDFLNRRFNPEKKTFLVTFVVSDLQIETARDVYITVRNKNQPPQITHLEPSDDIVAYTHQPIIFSIQALDPDQDNLIYQWSFHFWEEKITSPTVKRTFITPGYKKVKVKITDGRNTITRQWTIKVKSKKSEPKPLPQKFYTYVIEG